MSNLAAPFNASSLIPGQVYKVKAPFTDYDGVLHPAGETWRFVRKSFLPNEDGLSLFIEKNDQPGAIRLQWRPETQGQLIQDFSDYMALLPETPAGPPPAARAKKKMPVWRTLLIGLGLVIGLVVCLSCGAFLAFEYAISYHPNSSTQDKTGLDYNVVSQVNVKLNQDFVLEATFHNYDAQPKLLYSIGLPASYLAGAAVRDSQPPFKDFARLPGDPQYVIYNYMLEIPARGSLDLKFNLKALKSGDYSGKLRICIDSPTKCTLDSIGSIIQ